MYITDDLTNPTKWQIPSGITIPSGGYLLFWADNDDEEGSTHTNFNLNKDGEEIGLFDTDTRGNMLIDTVTFEEQILDTSYGRIYDGGEPWVFSETATPGYTNSFPAGTHNFIWKFSHIYSYSMIRKMGTSMSSIKRFNMVSGKWDTAYTFWSKPSGRDFSIEPDQNYVISTPSPYSISFSLLLF